MTRALFYAAVALVAITYTALAITVAALLLGTRKERP